MRMEEIFKALLNKSYFTKDEAQLIKEAFYFAKKAHHGQLRRSGEPYWYHVAGVAMKLMKLGFPLDFVLASLLHDCPEDVGISIGQISRKFGSDTAFLVDFMSRNELCEYFSYQDKVSIILNEYPWAIFLRLADISHNMETPEYYKNAQEKIEEAKMFIKLGEIIAIQRGEEVLKKISPKAFPSGIFGFIKRLEDKIDKAKALEGV